MSVTIAVSLDQALDALECDPVMRPIVGGVGVMLAQALGEPAATPRWLGVGTLPELRATTLSDDGAAVIGAAVTLEELCGGPGPPAGLLEAAARSVANPGIRVVATIGGNVNAGRAASDLVAALVALGADAEVMSNAGSRRASVDALVAEGLGTGELVGAFRVPSAPSWGWRRLTVRGAMDGSVASIAVVCGPRARVVVTFAADRVIRLPGVERLLQSGARHTDGDVRDAAAGDLSSVPLRADDRASEGYRRRVIPVLVERAVGDALERSGDERG